MTAPEFIELLKTKSNQTNREGMARFGINTEHALGISVTELRKLARGHKKQHQLALDLWASGIHEARILASIVDNPTEVTTAQMEAWVKEFDSWDICDQVCGNLFAITPHAVEKVFEWTKREEEFEKRAGFSLIAYLTHKKNNQPDSVFLSFLPVIKRESNDERNFVKKAINWALREIGKHNSTLLKAAYKTAIEIEKLPSKSARWIAKDAIREFTLKYPDL